MSSPVTAGRRLLAEPTFHFLVIGALLFVAHRLVVGDARVVVVSPGVRSELARAFQDSNGRPPTPAELDTEVHGWERDEALSREAIREGLDRNDRTIRTVLADHLRARVAQGIPRREPTQADLDGWLATHRAMYETPRRFDHDTVAFPRSSPSAAAELERYQAALKGGADARTLGRPLVGGNLTADELEDRVGPAVAARIQRAPVGAWQRVDTDSALMLVRVNGVQGGLPDARALRPRLVADWQDAEHQRQVDEALRKIVVRYRVEERR